MAHKRAMPFLFAGVSRAARQHGGLLQGAVFDRGARRAGTIALWKGMIVAR